MDQREQLRKAQLYIANEIKRVCEKNGIKYFLDCGSMLGAVRHHGFIPWDDDMDIGMKKEDYEHFLRIATCELGDEFFLDNYQSNTDNALVFSKVRLKNTTYIEAKGNPNAVHNEIFVDVFPYYYIADNDLIRRLEGTFMSILSQAIMSKSGYKVWKGEGVLKRLKFLPTDIVGALLSKQKMHSIIDYLYNKHTNTRRMCIHSGSCYGYWFFPKDVFADFIEVGFERYNFKIPSRYDEYLSIAYGDYMKLPPRENQATHLICKLDMGPYSF